MTAARSSLVSYAIRELGDPNAPVPAEVAYSRLKILGRSLVSVVLVGAVSALLNAWAYPVVAALICVFAVWGGMSAKAARARIIGSARHGLWLMSGVALVGTLLMHWFSNPNGQTFRQVFGISAGPEAQSIFSTIIPVIIVSTMVLVVLYEVKAVVTETRQISSRHDTRRYILEATRLRRTHHGDI